MSSDTYTPRRRGPNPRAVVDADGVTHRSVVAAAKAHRLSMSAVWQKATLQRGGWHYADEPLEPEPAPFPTQRG